MEETQAPPTETGAPGKPDQSRVGELSLPDGEFESVVEVTDYTLTDENIADIVAKWRQNGYVVVRSLFSPEDVEAIANRFDWWYQHNVENHHTTYIHRNLRVWMADDANVGRICRGMQWPSYTDEVMDKYRTDPRLMRILKELFGGSFKQIVNQMHWKTPNANVTWRIHQDVRSRTPKECFKNLGSTWTNTGIAIDDHTAECGAMKIYPRSGVECGYDLGIEQKAAELDYRGYDQSELKEKALLKECGLDPKGLKSLVLKKGDFAMWNAFTIHGGGQNVSKDNRRRFYINGFGQDDSCERGHLVMKDGAVQPLGDPVLVHLPYWNNPDPFYSEDPIIAKATD